MPVYRSKQPINTDKQFVFTCDVDMRTDFWLAFGLVNKKEDIVTGDLNELIEKMSALVAIDSSNQLLPDEYRIDSGYIVKNEVIEENKPFTFLDKECVWLGPVKLGSDTGKFYEKITSFDGQKDTYTDENNVSYAAAPVGKYKLISGNCALKNADYKAVATATYENSETKDDIKFNTSFEFAKKKIKLTISKNGIVSIYEQPNNNYRKLFNFKFSYADKNGMYLYIGISNQNILSNSAVSFVESSETS